LAVGGSPTQKTVAVIPIFHGPLAARFPEESETEPPKDLALGTPAKNAYVGWANNFAYELSVET